MSVVKELEKMIQDEVEQQLLSIDEVSFALKPYFLIDKTYELLGGRTPQWVRSNFCTLELQDRKLVKKIGGEWYFKNPEFFNYVHDEWLDKQ